MTLFKEYYEEIKKFDPPENFTIYEVALVGGNGTIGCFTYVQIKRAVFMPVTREKRLGEPNWRKKLDGSDRTYYAEFVKQQKGARHEI